MKFRLSLFLLFITPYLHAQLSSDCNFTIEGRIFGLNDKEPLPYVRIHIEGTEVGTISDEKGYFKIEHFCKRECDLICSSIGYKTLKHHHDFHHPSVEIYLSPDTLTLESIIVEAEAHHSNMASITSNRLSRVELEAVATESFGDVVSQIAGVTTISTGQNVVKPVIHGLHSNRVLVMNNGLRHEFQNWGEDHAPEIDPSVIDAVEVVKGAATVRYGPDALGGVILIRPPKMELGTPFKAEVNLTGKSNGQSGEGTVEFQKGFKWLSLLAGGSYVKQGDLHAANYMLTNTGKEENSYYGAFRIHPIASLDIEGYYSHFDQKLGILSASSFGNLEDLQRAIEADTPLIVAPFSYEFGQPYQDIRHDLYKASAKYVGKNQAFSIQYGYQKNQRKEFGVRKVDAPNIDLLLITESADADWQHPSFWVLSGKVGFQWQRQANDNQPGTNTVPFIPNYDSDKYGVYWIEAVEFGRNTLEFGARYDHLEAEITGREPDNTIYRNKIVYRNFSGTIGFTRKLNEHLFFRSNFGTAWRPPNVAELYRFGQHQFFIEYGLWRYTIDERYDIVSTRQGILTQEDREVPPEVGYKWINTFEIQQEDFQAEITAYVNYIENYISSQPAGITRTPRGNFVYFIYDQNDALFWGMDVSSKWQHSQKFASNIRGSFLWAQQLNPKDYFAGQPPPRISYEFAYQPKWKILRETSFNISIDYTFEQFQHPRILTVEEFLYASRDGINRFIDNASDFDILAPPPGYFLLNASWRSSYKKFSWQLQAKNMLNAQYRVYTDRLRYFADGLGRNVMFSLTYRL